MLSFLTVLSLIVLIVALNQIDTDNGILHNHPSIYFLFGVENF